MEEWGDRIDAYDLIVALSPAAMRQAQEYTRYHAIDVEYWPIFDPTGLGEDRDGQARRLPPGPRPDRDPHPQTASARREAEEEAECHRDLPAIA